MWDASTSAASRLSPRSPPLSPAGSLQVGDSLPSTTLYAIRSDDKGPEATTLQELFPATGKGILFGVPGAFTPGCTRTHLPGYVRDYDKLKADGVESIVCVSVNDPFVCKAWERSADAESKVIVAADPAGELAEALGLLADKALPVLGNRRCRRFSAIVKDGKIAVLNVEPPEGGLTCSLSNVILQQIKTV